MAMARCGERLTVRSRCGGDLDRRRVRHDWDRRSGRLKLTLWDTMEAKVSERRRVADLELRRGRSTLVNDSGQLRIEPMEAYGLLAGFLQAVDVWGSRCCTRRLWQGGAMSSGSEVEGDGARMVKMTMGDEVPAFVTISLI